jgi:nitrite reductase/ring-hydroxylating ferredoxin subunit
MSSELAGPRFEKPIERRDFLGLAAVWSFCAATAAAVLGSLRLPMPAVFPEAGRRFPIGQPGDFPVGIEINFTRQRIWVLSEPTGIRAVSTVCPHLGCVVARTEDGTFTCPCHGSKFSASGQVTGGPSPRGLVWAEVSLGPDGRLVADLEREVSPDTRLVF